MRKDVPQGTNRLVVYRHRKAQILYETLYGLKACFAGTYGIGEFPHRRQ